MKREDTDFIDFISKHEDKSYNSLKKTPLLVIDKDSEIRKEAEAIFAKHFIVENDIFKANFKKINEYIKSFTEELSFNEFSFIDCFGIDKDLNNENSLITFNVKEEKIILVSFVMKNDYDDIFHLMAEYGIRDGKLYYRFSDNTIEEINKHNNNDVSENFLKSISEYLSLVIIRLSVLFSLLNKTNLYPIEKTIKLSKKAKKRKENKGISEQKTIVYLNKFPVKYNSDSKGGTHSSPRYHHRRGHKRIMRDKRFKNHPDYMKEKWIKPMWIGKKETVINGVTYKVI